VTDLAALRLEKLHQQMPLQKWNAGVKPFGGPTNINIAESPPARNFRKGVAIEKGAAALRSPVAYWAPITLQSKPSETNLLLHPVRMFANDDKGATALMRIFEPKGATEGPDFERELLESVEIPPEALRTLASERAGNVRAYLLQTGKVQPQRITESARSSGSKGSCVYLWLR